MVPLSGSVVLIGLPLPLTVLGALCMVQIWDVFSGKKLSEMSHRAHEDQVTSIAFHPEELLLASGEKQLQLLLRRNRRTRAGSPVLHTWNFGMRVSCLSPHGLGFTRAIFL